MVACDAPASRVKSDAVRGVALAGGPMTDERTSAADRTTALRTLLTEHAFQR
jgi:hypothetical protein